MDIFELVKQEASKVYKVEAELNAFLNGFEKQASADLATAWHMAAQPGFMKSLAAFSAAHPSLVRAGFGLGAGLLGAGIVKGISSTSSAITNNALRSKFESALQFVRNNNKIVKNGNQAKVESYANTLFSFAPHVASDPNVLSSLLANAVLGEGIDPMTVKSITDLEGRYKENTSAGPLLGIKVT